MNSLEQAYIELQPKLYTFFVIKTSNIAVAEDLTQDIFYEASKITLGYTLETYSLYEKTPFKPNILYLTKENRSKEEAKEIVQNIQKKFNEAGVHYLEFQVQQEKMENNDLLYAFDVTKTITSLK